MIALLKTIFMPLIAHAQTVPTWNASNTELIVDASESAFVDTIVYALQIVGPYAIIIGLIWMVIRFFRRKG